MHTQFHSPKLRTTQVYALHDESPSFPPLDDAYQPSTSSPAPNHRSTNTPASSPLPKMRPRGLRKALDAIPTSYRDDPSSISLATHFDNAIYAKDIDRAWDTFQTILHNHPLGSRLISPRVLHYFNSLIWKQRPTTRQTFLRLVSITSELRATGNALYQWEWNALVHAAGAGIRKPSVDDYETALGQVQEMIADAINGSPSHPKAPEQNQNFITTLNTLLAIASRTGSKRTFQRALDMMKDTPSISSDAMTCRILLGHYARTGQLDSFPWCVSRLMELGADIGIDVMNALIWGYGRVGRLDYAVRLYQILRHNASDFVVAPPTTSPRYHKFEQEFDPHPILCIPGVDAVSGKPVADRITYITLIQCFAYFGDFTNAISVFRDLIGTKFTPRWHRRYKRLAPDTTFAPTVAVYRALFIGFAKFGTNELKPRPLSSLFVDTPPHLSKRRSLSHRTHSFSLRTQHYSPPSSSSPFSNLSPPPPKPLECIDIDSYSSWTLSSLQLIFDNFLELSPPESLSAISPTLLTRDHHASDSSPPFSSSQSSHLHHPSSHKPNTPPEPPFSPNIIYYVLVAFARTTSGDREIMRDAWYRMACAFDLSHPMRPPPATSEPSGHDGRYRVRGRLKTMVEWLEAEDSAS